MASVARICVPHWRQGGGSEAERSGNWKTGTWQLAVEAKQRVLQGDDNDKSRHLKLQRERERERLLLGYLNLHGEWQRKRSY